MRSVEFLEESFNSIVPYDVTRATDRIFSTHAVIGGREVIFIADIIQVGTDSDPQIKCLVEFSEIVDGEAVHDLTGSGNAMQVFSFVIASIKEMIAQYSPDIIMFSAEKSEPSRVDLYRTMLRRITVPGYKKGSITDKRRTTMYTLIKTSGTE